MKQQTFKAAIVIIALLGLGDAALTMAHAHMPAGFVEANPFACRLYEATDSAWSLAWFRLLSLAFGLAVLHRYHNRRSAQIGLCIVVAAFMLLAIRWGVVISQPDRLAAVAQPGQCRICARPCSVADVNLQ